MRKKKFVYGAFIAAALIGGCALEPVDGVTDLFGCKRGTSLR